MAEFKMSFVDNNFTISLEEENDLNMDMMEDVSVMYPVDHNDLLHRDHSDAHPISAITGLEAEIHQMDEHVSSVDVHVTPEEKENWNHKSRAYRNASGALILTSH